VRLASTRSTHDVEGLGEGVTDGVGEGDVGRWLGVRDGVGGVPVAVGVLVQAEPATEIANTIPRIVVARIALKRTGNDGARW